MPVITFNRKTLSVKADCRFKRPASSFKVTKPYKGKLPNGKDGQGWCITTTSQEAHETVEGYCFIAQAGIVEAVDENHGGESMESKATLVK